MSGQPKVENLVKGFVWAQLDQVNKRLYYVYPTVESTNNVSKSTGCMIYLFFHIIASGSVFLLKPILDLQLILSVSGNKGFGGHVGGKQNSQTKEAI